MAGERKPYFGANSGNNTDGFTKGPVAFVFSKLINGGPL